MNMNYPEIRELFRYCRKKGIGCAIMPLKDGYKIEFPNGGDVVQHSGSYGADNGCVEFAIGSRADYKATALRNAKQIVRRNKDRLSQERHR